MRVRITICSLVVVCAGLVVAGQDLWYRSYQDGVQAFNQGNYSVAAEKLVAAMSNRLAPKTRGRSVLYYGQLRGEFLPEYYLARAYAGQRRWDDALKYVKLAEAYVKTGDADYQKLVSAKEDAEKGLASPTLNADNRGTGPTPAGANSSSANASPSRGNPPPEDPATVARRAFDGHVADVTRLMAAGQYTQARQAATAAKALGVDSGRADELLKSVDVQDLQAQINTQLRARAWAAAGPLVDRLAGLDPASAVTRSARQQMTRGLAEDGAKQFERDGLTAFYRSDYQRALDTLAKVAPDLKTPRVLFYQACSTAALGLLQGDKSKLQKAHELFLQARPKDNLFTVDRRYISPNVIKALGAAS